MGHDIIVLGSGPAGLAAAVAARGRNKSVLVIGNRWQDMACLLRCGPMPSAYRARLRTSS